MTREIYNEKLEMIKELLRLKAKRYDVQLEMYHRDDEKILFYNFYRYRGEDAYRGAISVCIFSSFYGLNRTLDDGLSRKFGPAKNLDEDDFKPTFDSRLSKEREKPDYGPFYLKEELSRLRKKLGDYVHKDIENARKFKIKNVISNGPATIVFWADGTKTVVKTQDEAFDAEKGLAMAIAKRALGDTSAYYDVFKKWVPKIEEGQPVEPVKAERLNKLAKDFREIGSNASEAFKKLGNALREHEGKTLEEVLNEKFKQNNEDSTEIDILPCPHCGEKPVIYNYTGTPTAAVALPYEYEHICGKVGYTYNGANSTYQGLIKDWNKRVEMIKQDNE